MEGGSFPFALPDIPVGTATYPIPEHTYAFAVATRVDWGSEQVQALGGDGFAYDGQGDLVGGTATALFISNAGIAAAVVLGFSLNAASCYGVTQTASTADDIALFNQIFTGNDLIALSAENDVFNAGLGRDLVIDQGGADRINAGGGNDLVQAGKGNDRVDAGLGNDVVLGGAGNDVVQGGTGADVIWAGVGSDTVAGGLGADAFLFKAGDGTAVITDFSAADDQILFMGPKSGLANLHMMQMGADLKITFSDVTVILRDTLRSEVTLADVAAGGNAALATAADAFFLNWDYVA
jgi:Ca2+-binding RTX toxin-like protein